MANARPEPPYYYPSPFTGQSLNSQNLGVSTRQNLGQTASLLNYNTAQQNYVIPGTSYGTPILRNTGAGVSVTSSSSASSAIQQGYTTGGVLPSRNYGSPDLLSSHQAPNSVYLPQNRPVNIQKHIYVHVAPPDTEEEHRQRIQQQQIPSQKHYKIIFIKTPTYQPSQQYIAQQQALQQEKTLVYVLVKKPEEPADIPAAQVAAAPVSKPEVYFIRYKAKSEPNVGGGHGVQQVENLQDDSVVIESAAGRGASGSSSAVGYNQGQGYNYDRPVGILK